MSPGAVDNNNVGWAYYNAGYTQKTAKTMRPRRKITKRARLLKEAPVQEPQFDAAYVNLGATHNELGEHQEAVDALKTADKLHPNWNVALNQLGRAFRGLKDFVNAIANFKRVVDMDGSSVVGLFNLGESYNASGNKKEAKKMYDRLKRSIQIWHCGSTTSLTAKPRSTPRNKRSKTKYQNCRDSRESEP
ncbi:MAG: tetratricopeptide repeat protein [Chloracidobacterium sp.]|nr:tetratricopeptide repeat protein [Chloracidobacterium sp.]